MATYGSGLRRGLPRVAGGEAWPAAAVVEASAAVAAATEPPPHPVVDTADQTVPTPSADAVPGVDAGAAPAAPAAPAAQGTPLRRGLPRTPGGEAWPAAAAAAAATVTATAGATSGAVVEAGAGVSSRFARGATDGATTGGAVAEAGAGVSSRSARSTTGGAAPGATTGVVAEGAALRRGLPRTPDGEPWPPAGSSARVDAAPEPVIEVIDVGVERETVVAVPEAPAGPRAPLSVPRTVWPGRSAKYRVPAPVEPKRIGPFTRLQWAGAAIIGGGGLLFAAGMAVVFVRFFLSLDFMQDFIATYPGEYHLPEGAPVGIPAWLGWQHFFNVFLMVLIIRSGLTIRREKRPAVFWTPRGNAKGKTSLTIWFHQSLDLLWIVNGLVFVVLLFVTGQWMRIVPTSWEVFPNALSAALQYVSLDWPTENGWVNYNSLQQIAYFTTVFVAAPLAVASGFRMSGLWPKKSAKLNAAFPIEWARKVHFPVMLFFVVFIIIHVALVLATGALRNLNHMYASLGSVDGVAYADNWTGFWMFVLSLAVIAGAWVAARPLVLAPIARLFGTVSGR